MARPRAYSERVSAGKSVPASGSAGCWLRPTVNQFRAAAGKSSPRAWMPRSVISKRWVPCPGRIKVLAAEINALRDEDFDLDVIGFSDAEIDDLFIGLGDQSGSDGDGEFDGGGGGSVQGGGAGTSTLATAPSATLAERFGIPPFSVLDARKGWWQDRKRAWLEMGIRSELGRGEGERACPGGSVMPGQGTRKDYQPGAAKAFNDGAVLGKGGLADQVAAAATARRIKKGASNG